MKKIFLASSIAIAAISGVMMLSISFVGNAFVPNLPFDSAVKQAFELKGIKLSDSQVKLIRENVRLGVLESCKSPQGNSKVGFTAVEVADQLNLNPAVYSLIVDKIGEAIESVAAEQTYCQAQTFPPIRPIDPVRPYHPRPDLGWKTYFKKTVSLNNDNHFLSLLQDKAYSPVHISWEDIGRYENSVWGDRISDVGIWVRKDEKDPSSAELALSVRRDNNFSDKVLVVPADKIKIHQKIGTKTIEKTLPQRLKELGLSSALRDKNVIVSNQFSIVPVPARSIQQRSRGGHLAHPPRVAFNFSIFPYGSTNYVITDVIEGSSEAVVGPGSHQLLYSNVNGKKAPFTASRAEDRQDLLKLEAELKRQGMDVDVQRYYLIQVPIKHDAQGVQLSNMGRPPEPRYNNYPMPMGGAYESDVMPPGSYNGAAIAAPSSSGYMPKNAAKMVMPAPGMPEQNLRRAQEGLVKVAIGHGETEGKYFGGSGFSGKRSDEPVRVTVVYFVTPIAEVSEADMQNFANAFQSWDSQAIWGGSFVTTASK